MSKARTIGISTENGVQVFFSEIILTGNEDQDRKLAIESFDDIDTVVDITIIRNGKELPEVVDSFGV